MNKDEIKLKIADVVIEWHRLRGIVKKLKTDRGSPHCGCSIIAGSSCYIEWRTEQIGLDEMLECDVASKYYVLTQPLRETSRKAAGVKNKLNHLIKLYDKP